MRMNTLVFVCTACMIMSAVAEARQTALRREDRNLLGAMARNGCSASWLSVVMRDSNILEDDLRRLRPGTPLVMPDGCAAHQIPSKRDLAVTRRIFAHQAMMRRNSVNAHADALLNAQYAQTREALSSANTRIAALEAKNRMLQRAASDALHAAQPEPPPVDVATPLVTFALGVLLTTGILYLIFMRPMIRELTTFPGLSLAELAPQPTVPPRTISLPEGPALKSVEYFGEMIFFKDTTIRQVGCPFCSASNIKDDPGNMRRHLNTHPHLRVQKVSYETITQLLKQCA